MKILLSTHRVLHRASQQILWWGEPVGAQRPRVERPRRRDGNTSSLQVAVAGSGSDYRSSSSGKNSCSTCSVGTRLYSSSCSLSPLTATQHTHTFYFLAVISNIHSPNPSNCDKSTGSRSWIIGSIKRQMPWPMLQGHSHALPALQFDWLFNWLCKWDQSRCFRCHSLQHGIWEQVEKLGSQMTHVFMLQVSDHLNAADSKPTDELHN